MLPDERAGFDGGHHSRAKVESAHAESVDAWTDGLKLKGVVSLSLGAVGAALGIINTLNALNQQQVKLRVVPKIAIAIHHWAIWEKHGCIEVANLSALHCDSE